MVCFTATTITATTPISTKTVELNYYGIGTFFLCFCWCVSTMDFQWLLRSFCFVCVCLNHADPESYTDSETSNLKPAIVDYDKKNYDPEKKYDDGVGEEESFSYTPPDPAGPAAKVTSNPTIAKIKEPVNFDASKSHDCDNEPCKTFKWDFGDGSPAVITKEPYTKHPYEHPGTYPVTVEVTDKYGKTANASLQQKYVLLSYIY